jgi:AraC-like DNA-binding protein
MENAMAVGRVCVHEARLGNDHRPWDVRSLGTAAFQRRSDGAPKLTARQLSTVKGFMLGRLSDRLSIGDVASVLSLSTSYFVRSFTNTTGVSPYSWLVEQRINEARQLLTRTAIPLAEIALECGFTDQSHFTNAFGRRVGTTPSRWRKGDCGIPAKVVWDRKCAGYSTEKRQRILNQGDGDVDHEKISLSEISGQ